MKNLGQVTEHQDIARKQDIPTKTSELTNDSGFVNNSALSGYLPLSGGTLTGDIKMKQVGSNPSNTFGSEFYFFNCYAGGTSPYGFGMYQWIDNFQFTTRNSATNGYIATAFEINGATGVTDYKARPTVVGTGVALTSEVPTKTSELTNDSGYITSADLPESSGGGVTSVVGQTGDVTATQIKTALQTTDGGFAAGDSSVTTYGGAVGASANTTIGGAVGAWSKATTGFAGGYNAQALADGAVQLGQGTNSTANTLQFRDYQLLNASGNIPKERLSSTSVTSVAGNTGDVTSAQLITAMLTGATGYGDKISAKDFTSSGKTYIKYQSGLIIQWGYTTLSATTTTITFGTPFQSTRYSIVASKFTGTMSNALYWHAYKFVTQSNSNITIQKGFSEANETIFWIAIGY